MFEVDWLSEDLELLEYLTGHFGLEYDAGAARAARARADRDLEGSGSSDRVKAFIEEARDLGLRLTVVRQTTRSAVQLVHPSAAILALGASPRQGDATGGGIEAELVGDGQPSGNPPEVRDPRPWHLLIDRKGRSTRLAGWGREASDRWVSREQLCGLLGLEHPDMLADWLIVTPIAPCNSAALGHRPAIQDTGHHGHADSHWQSQGTSRLRAAAHRFRTGTLRRH
jgi:hypothetical protein